MTPLDKIKAVEQMQQYIEAHLHDVITMHELAECTAYSPWHASRIFKELLGTTPFEYIRKIRLSRAAKDLWNEDTKILDVAIDYVFDSHEGFTRAFRKQFHLTPSAYKKETPPLPLYQPDSIRDHYRYLQGGDPICFDQAISTTYFVQVVKYPKRKLIYQPCYGEANDYFSYVKQVGCDGWGILCSIKEALYEPVGLWFPDTLRPEGCSTYVQGVEVPISYDKGIPDGFACMTLPEVSMMVFQGSPYEDERFCEAIRYLNAQIEQYDPTLYGYAWANEQGPYVQLEPLGYRGYMEARPVVSVVDK